MAILVAIVGCFFIWRLDAARAEEVERPSPAPESRQALDPASSPTPPRSIDS